MEKSFQAQPDIFKAPHHPFQVEVWHENALTKATLDSFLNTVSDGIIGMAPAYGVKCALTSLALSSQTHVLFIRLSTSKASHRSRKQKDSIGRAFLQELLLDQSIRKHAFKMDKLAAALYTDLRIHIANGLDLLSVAKGDDRQSLSALMFVLGGEVKLNKPQVIKLFEQEEKDTGNISDTAAQAWAACQAAFIEITSKQLANSLKINTHILDETHLVVLAKIVRDGDRLVAQKPTRQKNEVDKKYSHKQGNLNLTSTRFRTRVMRLGEKQTVEVQTIGQRGANRISAKVLGVNGRAAFLSVQGHFSGTLRSITTVGRESLTMSEAIRGEIVLRALQQTNESVMKHPFVQRIWLPAFKVSWKNTPSSTIPVAISFPPPRKLNTSQTMAVKAILSNNALDRITMIHGPPGTGKTTVIAAAVTSILNSPDRTRTIWLVAQSNVAVKNIAEKLVDVGVVAFRLLVSKDFHYDWHEHLYQQIEEKIIRSDNFVEDVMAAERLLLGSRVILCTLSMLSHKRLTPFTTVVPPQMMIFDEASQIEVGDYFPPLQRFQPTLRKLVFIGDDKQLAPYGQNDIPELCSIFEMPHLRGGAIFLDTQYRMPMPIGDFISRNVYGGRLKSVHPVTAVPSCAFVDVANGQEEKSGHSWVNSREVAIAIHLARIFQASGKAYRIITPYDAQRSRLENALKAAKLAWEDKCFNVDSFQGNEADYIILSLVRSEKTGFMKDARRTNVMLTRCKKGMIILTSRKFVEGPASSTLIGNMAKVWRAKSSVWIESGHVVNGSFRPPA